MSGTTSPVKKPAAKKSAGRSVGSRSLTMTERAEAAALWRSGSVTLEDLAKKFKKRPETFSRLFTRMGVEKGSTAASAMRKAELAIASRIVNQAELTLERITQVKDSHFAMSRSIALMAFKDLQQAKRAELDIGKLKDIMAVYKMASEVVGNSRKELFQILDVEGHKADSLLDDLPDLTVRELTQDEVEGLRNAPEDDLDTSTGAGMLDLDDSDFESVG
jgi:hypothetical protein